MSTLLMEPYAPWLRGLERQLGGGAGPAPFFPPADVIVTDADVTVHVDLPGVTADRVEVQLERGALSIRGERPYPYSDDDREGEGGAQVWRRIERGFGRFERVVRMPHGLDADAVEASMNEGVLTLRVRKPEPERPHRIEIRAASGRGGGGSSGSAGSQGAAESSASGSTSS